MNKFHPPPPPPHPKKTMETGENHNNSIHKNRAFYYLITKLQFPTDVTQSTRENLTD